MSSSSENADDLKKDLTIIIAAIGGTSIAMLLAVIVIVSVILAKLKDFKKQLDITNISIRTMQKEVNEAKQVIERLPKNIVQFPITKTSVTVIDDVDDRASTEPASPVFFRKGYTPTPLASSLNSVTEIPSGNQFAHHPLHRNNALLHHHRSKPIGPPVPPKRAHSFNAHSFNY